jgi:hypothetical protein
LSATSPSAHRFHYHASAHALSGQFFRPVQRIIEVQAPSVLPSIGGLGSSRVDNFRFDEFVSFKAGYTHVLGSEMEVKNERGVVVRDGQGQPRIAHTTQVTATVEGLNILDVVTADRIVARLTSVHDAEDRGAKGEPRILLLGSRFENLRIAGCRVEVILHHSLYLKVPTFESIGDLKGEDETEFWDLASESLDAVNPGAELAKRKPEAPQALLCSIVKDLKFEWTDEEEKACAGVTPQGRHRLHVEDFGNIYLGEVLLRHGEKTLTMLRIELGSPNGAGLLAAQVSSDGQPPWG